MALTGQLSDMSLAELIEFFCNQRKTGRLKVDYPLAPGVFFVKEGELTDAKVGALNGKDAVFFALTLPSATFDFSAGVQSSRRTINEPWASVVLEGLRRIDEGAMPEFDVFGGGEEVDAATLDYLDCLEDSKSKSDVRPAGDATRDKAERASRDKETGARRDKVESNLPPAASQPDDAQRAPLSFTVEASRAGGRSKALVAGVVAAVVLLCAVAAVPVARHFSRNNPNASPVAQPAPQTNAGTTNSTANDAATADKANSATGDASAGATASPDASAEEAARLEREREARERARKQREDAARAEAARNAAQDQALAPLAKPTPTSQATGPKTVRVQISYDEAGRVTQAAAVGTSPGAEAYAATAVRIARGRHFTPGKAGTTVVTIPIN
jgi:hypothetical protein